MKFYPLFLDLRSRACLVVGGGSVAERKVRSLLAAEAAVSVVSPALTAGLDALAADNAIAYRNKEFAEEDLGNAFLVIAATDSPAVNVQVAAACRERGVLVNVAAPPEASDCIVPSVLERGELQIAISTGGSGPALAKKVRLELEAQFGPEWERFLLALGRIRKRILAEIPQEEKRRSLFQALADSEALVLFRQGKDHEAELLMQKIAGLGPGPTPHSG